MRGAAYVAAWLLCSVATGLWLFLDGEREITVASHDAHISPDFSGWVELRTGPVLPDLRVSSGSLLGVDVRLGKTEAPSTAALVERYAFIASQPDGPVDKVRASVRSMAVSAAARGALLGAVPVVVWVLVGHPRRRELVRTLTFRRATAVGLSLAVVATGLWVVREPPEETVAAERQWVPMADFLGEQITVPEELRGVEVLRSVTTAQTRRLVLSAIDTYRKSLEFYAEAAEDAERLTLRTPEDGETTVVLISDRHDNVGMDAVARTIAERAEATGVLDAGDDTSTGSKWEAFSLDSLAAAYSDFEDRWVATGNHDQGEFVSEYLSERGWTVLDGEVVDGPGDGRLLGVGDPRSSGLGNWRDETGLSFTEVAERVADEACAADEEGERVNTILVHDHNLGDKALARGCADLVVGGHTHVREGPTAVRGQNGETGYYYVTGTAGGAAYALAIGSKLRRAAGISLVTYDEDGRPAGVQPVTLETNGRFVVGAYERLTYDRGERQAQRGRD